MKHLVRTGILGFTLALAGVALHAQTKTINLGQTSVARAGDSFRQSTALARRRR